MKMIIGILGTRGIPNAYGGFEQFAEQLSYGLTKKGHDVFVYNSSLHPYKKDKWNDVHIIHAKDWEDKLGTFGQFLYDRNCFKDAQRRNFDILLQLGYTSNAIWHRMWPKKMINIVNMDGLEWKRTKYSKPVQWFLKKSEAWAAKYADHLIADSTGIQKHLKNTYNKQATFIAYAADIFSNSDVNILNQFNLHAKKYYLLIARMEPENNIEMIIQGYLKTGQQYPLVIVGNTANKFGQLLLKKYSTPSIKFLGSIFETNLLNNLRYFSLKYFHGHSVGGTNPSLLEAMACKCSIIAHDNIFNKAVLENDADYFSTPQMITSLLTKENNCSANDERIQKNLEKIKTHYNKEKIINDYETLMFALIELKQKNTGLLH